MTTVGFTTRIARRPEDVFDLLSDVRRNSEWSGGFAGAEQTTPGPIGPGTAFQTRAQGVGDLLIRVEEYERPTRLGFLGLAQAVSIRHRFTLTPEGEGTQLTQRIDVQAKGPLRPMTPLMAVALKRTIKRNTADLARYLEGHSVA